MCVCVFACFARGKIVIEPFRFIHVRDKIADPRPSSRRSQEISTAEKHSRRDKSDHSVTRSVTVNYYMDAISSMFHETKFSCLNSMLAFDSAIQMLYFHHGNIISN